MRTGTELQKYAGKMMERSKMYIWEDNDCTVIAMQHAYNLSYDVAWRLCTAHGRVPMKGFHFRISLMKALKVEDVSQWFQNLSLDKVMKMGTMNTGTFFVFSPSHVFCVKDGKIFDNGGAPINRSIKAVFKVLD